MGQDSQRHMAILGPVLLRGQGRSACKETEKGLVAPDEDGQKYSRGQASPGGVGGLSGEVCSQVWAPGIASALL